MSVVEIISAVLGLTCVFLAGRNSKLNFWVGYVYNVFLFILFWRQHLYSAMILQPVAFALNAYGHWRWTHPAEDERSAADPEKLKVSSLGLKRWPIVAIVIIGCGLIWALVLESLPQRWPGTFAPDPSPVLDSFILMFTFLAQFLSARKNWECWLVWLVVNAANIVLYLKSGLYFMPAVSLLYLVNGIWALANWRKMLGRNE